MPTKLKKRGGVYHIAETVTVGDKSVRIRKTTGCRDEKTAEIVRAREVAKVTERLLRGENPAADDEIPGFATTAADYEEYKREKEKKPLGNQDRNKLLTLGEYFGEKPANEFEPEDWDDFVEEKLGDEAAPGTVRRWFAMFLAPLRRTAKKCKFMLPDFVVPPEGPIREIFLEPEDRDGLLACYADHARNPARMMCYQGCRHFEALRVDWPDASLRRNTVTYRVTKNGESRTVPLHPEVRADLERMYRGQTNGRVFLTPDGKPYVDRRAASHGDGPDGSGLRTAHRTALRRFTIKKLLQDHKTCRHCGCALVEESGRPASPVVELAVVPPAGEREQLAHYALSCASCHEKPGAGRAAKINWFRLHDWRHHWASWAAMDGCDPATLMALGGWKSEKMVRRYVKLDVRHLAKKLGQSQRS
jgi:integrase